MAGKRKGGFAFDLFQPLKKGVLLKQGQVHTAFKYRFFVLYPGFFVYYEKESKWRADLTKGETLDSRIGAIKLIGGTCNIARNPPKGCKFGFTIHAPDPLNKRPTYLINGTSKQDRDEWVEAIRRATPSLGGGNQHKREPSPERITGEPWRQPQSSYPPSYSASPAQTRQYNTHVPPSVEKNRSAVGSEFNPAPHRQDERSARPTSPWQPPNTQVAPRRPTPIQPPRPPVRHYPPGASAQPIRGIEDRSSPSRPAGAASSSWQTQRTNGSPKPFVPPAPPPAPPMPAPPAPTFKPKPPGKQFPAEIAAIMDTSRGSPGPEQKRDGDQWIKAIRKSTNTTPAWQTQRKDGGSPKREKKLPKPPMPMPSTSSAYPKKTEYKQKPLPPPPPEPEDPSSVYVNLDDLDGDEADSSSDDDSPQPPPYVPPRSQKFVSEVMTPVNFDALGRQLGISSAQRFIEKKGFLYKLGSKRKSWTLRFFVLRPGVFTYAKNPQNKVSEVVKLKNLQIYYPGVGERKTAFQFMVHTESTWNKKADWELAAQTDREMKDWIMAFKLAAGQNV